MSRVELKASCDCGQVQLGAQGAPIICLTCYCDDCQESARQLESHANARRIADVNGGTEFVLFRKDRVDYLRGADLLKGYKIEDGSATTRQVATCCNAPMAMVFEDSRHWIPVYRARILGEVPPIEMLICTKYAPVLIGAAGGVPAYTGYPMKFMARLLVSGIAMLLRPRTTKHT